MALRIDSSQNRNLYVGTGTEVAVSDGNAIVTGNVGIGTTGPGTKLDVRGSGYFLGTASSGAALVTIENNSGSTATSYGLLVIGGGNSSNGRTFEVRDASGNTDLIVKGNGNVGIGTTAVTQPGFWYDATNKYLAISHWATPPTPAALLHLSDNANDIDVPQIRIEGRENPGDTKLDISVKDPDVRFNLIENTPDANAGFGLMIFKTNAVANSANPTRGGFNFQTPASSSSLFITNEANVGIGTTSPGARLHIEHNNNNPLKLENTTGVIVKAQFEDNASRQAEIALHTGSITFSNGTSGVTERMRITSAGNVGIGTTAINGAFGASNTILAVKGKTSGGEGIIQITGLGNNATDNVGVLAFHSYNEADAMCSIRSIRGSANDIGNMAFLTNNGGTESERMRITSGGDVGIGTADGPDDVNSKLHVYKNAGANTVVELLRLDCGENNHLVGKGGSIIWRDIDVYTNTASITAQRTGNTGNSTLQFGLRGSEKMRIDSAGAIKFNAYGAGTLVSDASGNITVSSGGGAGGPYLPLAGGTMTLATSPLILPGEESNQFKIAFTGASASSGLSTVDQSGAGLYIGANSRVNNSGVVVYHNSALPSSGIYFDGWNGDDMEFYTGSSGNPTKRLTIQAGGDAIFTGNVGIGTTLPSSYDAEGDNLVVYDDTTPGITIALPQTTAAGSARGSLLFSDGTSGSEKYRGGVIYDHGTGMGGQADTMYLRAAVNSYLVLNASGNVGIGIKEPTAKLHLFTSGSDPINLGIQNSERYYKIETDGGYLTFNDVSAGGTARMVIDSSGNVGIGTTSPTQSKLVISGGATGTVGGGDAGITMINKFDNPDNSWSILPVITGVSNTGFSIRDNTDSADRLVIDGSGNVGIGTTSPAHKLEVQGVISSADASLQKATFANVGNDLVLTANADATNVTAKMLFNSSGAGGGTVSTKMIIDGSGNVGIGTTSPAAKLHIQGTASSNGGIRLHNNGGNPYSIWSDNNDLFISKGDGTSTAISVKYGGNVGIGTTNPSSKLNIAGLNSGYFVDLTSSGPGGSRAIRFIDGGTPTKYNWLVGAQHNVDNAFEITASTAVGGTTFNSPLFLVNQSGNVGIGVTGPLSPLSIQANSGGSALRFIGRSDGISGIDFFNSTQTVGNYFQSNGTWIRSRADGGFHFSKGSTPIITDVDGFTIEGMNVGIGTANPSFKLHVDSDVASGDVCFVHHDNPSQSSGTVMKIRSDAGDNAGSALLNIENNTGNALYVRGDRNVGIGTTSPDANLDVAGTSPAIRITNTIDPLGAADVGSLEFFTDDSSTGASRILSSIVCFNSAASPSVPDGQLIFKTSVGGAGPVAATEKMRIDAAGNVGIGTTNPAYKLVVYETGTATSNVAIDARATGAGTNNYAVWAEGSGASSTNFAFYGAAGKNAFLGDTGIGTDNPGSKLQVAGEIRAADGNKGTPSYTFTSDTNTGMYSDTADVIDFTAGGTKSLSVTTSGATVYGSALMPSNAAILLQNQNNNNQFYIRNSGVSDATFQVGQGAPGSNVRFFINGSGNVGIGNTASTASVKLEVTGNTLLKNSNGVGDLYLGNYATANHFRFHTNNANTYFDMNCGDIYWRQGTSTRYQFFPSTANMTVQGTITQNSDARIKENVVEISDCISKVQAMRGVYYNRTDFNTDVTKVGVIAQEVEAVLPELVLESPETGLKSVAYSELTSVLINAIKEQQEIIEDLKTRITKLEN